MMDISDGLSTDLHRLCRASNVGAIIYRQHLPCVMVPRSLRNRGMDPLALALHGGDDYGLLFTVPSRLAARIPARFGTTRISRIGEITARRRVLVAGANGKVAPLSPRGWDHFAEKPLRHR
jgi:thiamine-monophosphate kinase